MSTLKLPIGSPLHDRVRDRLQSFIRFAEQGHQQQHDKWRQAENATLAYLPESEADALRRSKRVNQGTPSYTTIQIPYTYALLMSAHTYWTSVFFARSPVHQFAGRHGEGEMQTQAIEALIAYQVEVGQMMAPYYIWLYDIGKYGAGILQHYWCKETLYYGQLVEMDGTLYQATQELPGYEGNRVYNISVWDFMHDPRVPLKRFQQGEFCCARKRMKWTDIMDRKTQGYFNDNVDKLKDHLTDKGAFVSSSALNFPNFSLKLQYDDDKSKYPAGGVFWEVYVHLVPDDWGLGNFKLPQKWCFTITEDLEIVVGASPLGYFHCEFPFDVGESEVEGYGLYTRGMPDIMNPIQNTIDWLLNSHFYNVRAALNNQFIVDPSKIVIKDVKNSGPGFVWRLRPEAYGTDISKMFMQVPVSDVTRSHLTDYQAMLGIGERTLGVNDQIMGSLSTGPQRKTATEVRTSTGFGVNRLKTITEYISNMAFGPHAVKLVQNSQQLYSAQAKLRRVGSLALEAGQSFVDVTPEAIKGFFDFVQVDGTLPVDRMAQANLWKEILQGISQMPQIAATYDIGRIFAWMAQIGGLKNINQFKIQVMPPGMGPSPGAMPMMPPQLQPPGLGAAPPAGPPKASPGANASTQAGLNAMTHLGSSYA
jgi:hypothetical protein